MRKSRLLVCSLSVAGLLAGLCGVPGAGAAGTGRAARSTAGLLKQVAQRGSIKVITTDSVPYSYEPVGQPNTLRGVAPDILRGFFKWMGLGRIQIQPVVLSFPDSIPALEAGHADMLLDLFYITPAREKIIDFAKPVMMDPEALVVKRGNPLHIKTLADLCGRTVGVNKGTAYADLMVQENKKCPAGKQATITFYPNYQGQFSDVAAGRIDATIIDAPVAAVAIKKNPSLGIQMVAGYKPSLAAPISVMFRKGHDAGMVRPLDAYLKRIRDNGQLASILAKAGLKPVRLFLASKASY